MIGIMSAETFVDGLEPRDPNAAIWRFVNRSKFEDLIRTGELYFCRADRFKDESEGLPPEDYVHVLGLNPLDIRDRQQLNNEIGAIAQFREGFYVNCWYLFAEETATMWKNYGQEGVAICSRYGLLKSALASCPYRALLGLVRYGSRHLTGWNIIRFITTKQERYKHEQEVRAILWMPDQYAGINRHFDENNRAYPHPLTPPPDRVPDHQRCKVDLQSLITEVVVSPFAADGLLADVKRLISDAGLCIPVRSSGLAAYRRLLP